MPHCYSLPDGGMSLSNGFNILAVSVWEGRTEPFWGVLSTLFIVPRQHQLDNLRWLFKRDFSFIVNPKWSATTVAEIYKQRWQVELFFKWIKQNLKIKSFLGTTDNAVMTQIMVALCVYLILAFIKFQSKLKQSLQQMIRLIQTNLFAKRSLIELFRPPPNTNLRSPQMSLLSWQWLSGTAVGQSPLMRMTAKDKTRTLTVG